MKFFLQRFLGTLKDFMLRNLLLFELQRKERTLNAFFIKRDTAATCLNELILNNFISHFQVSVFHEAHVVQGKKSVTNPT